MKPNFTSQKLFLSTVFLFAAFVSMGQAIEFAILPFNRVGNLIYIEARVDQQDGAFLIDTGYDGILLNNQHYEGTPSDLYLRGSNGLGGRLELITVDIDLGLLKVKSVEAQVGDLSKLEQSIGLPLHGMIGSTFFQDFELVINYKNNNLVLVKLDHRGNKMVELPTLRPASDTLDLRFKGHLPVVGIQVGGRELCLGIDTGASSNLFRSNSWSKLEEFVWGKQELYLRGLGNDRRKTRAGMVSHINMEGIPFRSMRTLFGNIGQLNRDLAGPDLDGIVGYEFLHQYTMGFNYRKGEMYLWREDVEEDRSDVDYTAGNESE